MKQRAVLSLLVFVSAFFVGLQIQGDIAMAQSPWISESKRLHQLFTKVGEGLIYCYSDRSKTTGTPVRQTKDGTWFVTAQHKVDRDFPEASKIFVKKDRRRGTEVYKATTIITPENRELDVLLFFVPDLRVKHVFKEFRDPYRYEETWVFGFRGGADKVPGSPGYVTDFIIDSRFIFSSASIWRGCSGAPVINRQGVVLGLAVRTIEDSTDTLFISGAVVKKFIDESLEDRK